MYIYTHTHAHTHTHTDIYIHIYTHTCIYIHTYIYTYMSGQLSITNSNNSSVVNTMCISSFHYIHVITSRKFQFRDD